MIKVTKQYTNQQAEIIGVFPELSDARLFVQARIEWDQAIGSINTTYKIIGKDGSVETQIWDKSAAKQAAPKAGFHPTPTPTVLRPPGAPHYLPDDEE